VAALQQFAVKNMYPGRIVGCSNSDRMKARLAVNA
jgi:hypothetical protein